jgi:beta-galactosidase
LAEHWNWSGDARKVIPVEFYTNGDSAELFLNGRSLGEKKVAGPHDPVLRWEVPNEAGVVRAVGKQGGVERARFELATTGAAEGLRLRSDAEPGGPGSRVVQVEIEVVDTSGRRVATANPEVTIEVSGPGVLAALDSGDIRDTTPVGAGKRKAYEGRLFAIFRTTGSGKILIRASAPGLKAGEAMLEIR